MGFVRFLLFGIGGKAGNGKSKKNVAYVDDFAGVGYELVEKQNRIYGGADLQE